MSYRILADGADRTGEITRESISLGGQAFGFEASSGGFDLDDDAGVVTFPSLTIIELWEDATFAPTLLAWGRVRIKDLGRGERFDAGARRFGVSVDDRNADLSGIIVHGWSRPTETDVARIKALRLAFLHGASSTSSAARDSTDLDADYIANSHKVSMVKNRYDASSPQTVAADLIAESGKVGFLTVDGKIFYDAGTSQAYAAGLIVSDDPADFGFEPIWTGSPGTQDGTEFLTGGRMIYGPKSRSVVERRSSVEAAYDRWEEAFTDDRAKTAAQARTRLRHQLDLRAKEETRFTFDLLFREDQVDLLSWGQTFSFRAAAAGVTTARVVRASRVMWTPGGTGHWIAHVEASFPKKVAPRLFDVGKDRARAREDTPVELPSGCISDFRTALGGFVETFSFGPTSLTGSGAGLVIALTSDPGGGEIAANAVPSGFAAPITILASILTDVGPDLTKLQLGIWDGVSPTNCRSAAGLLIDGGTVWLWAGTNTPGAGDTGWPAGSLIWVRIEAGANGAVVATAWLDGTDSDADSFARSDGAVVYAASGYLVRLDGGANKAGSWTIQSLELVEGGDCDADPPGPEAYAGAPYGPIAVATADGILDTWPMPYPFRWQAGTLDVRVDGVHVATIAEDPDAYPAGTFQLDFVPAVADEISAYLRVPNDAG